MRPVKLTGLLLTLGAVAALAFAAAPASATGLCKASEETCKSENLYPGGTEITSSLATGKKARFLSGFVGITCTSASFTNKAEAGTPLAGKLTALSQAGCTNNITGGACTFTAYNLPAKSSLSETGGGNGKLSIEGAGFEYFCPAIIGKDRLCRYTTSSFELTLTAGAPASFSSITAKLAKQAGSDSLCSPEASWGFEGGYNVNSPNPLYVSVNPYYTGTSLCKVEVNPCPVASRYAEGQGIEGSSTKVSFNNVLGAFPEINCTGGSLKGTVGAVSGSSVAATISALSATSCSSNGTACTVSFETPNNAKFTTSTGPNGSLSVSNLRFAITCKETTCKYGIAETPLSVLGGSSATLALSTPVAKEAGSGLLCHTESTVSGAFTLSAPSPLYLESSS